MVVVPLALESAPLGTLAAVSHLLLVVSIVVFVHVAAPPVACVLAVVFLWLEWGLSASSRRVLSLLHVFPYVRHP